MTGKPAYWQYKKSNPKKVEMVGKTVPWSLGNLTVLEERGRFNGHTRWLVRCQDGHESIHYGQMLRNGEASCKECKSAKRIQKPANP